MLHHHRAGLAGGEPEGVLVEDLGRLLDEGDVAQQPVGPAGGVEVPLGHEAHRLGGDLRAVVEEHARAHLDGVRQPVGVRLPGLEVAGHQVARGADEGAVLLHGPVEDGRLIHQLERLVGADEVGTAGVQRLDIAGDADNQDTLLVLHRFGSGGCGFGLRGGLHGGLGGVAGLVGLGLSGGGIRARLLGCGLSGGQVGLGSRHGLLVALGGGLRQRRGRGRGVRGGLRLTRLGRGGLRVRQRHAGVCLGGAGLAHGGGGGVGGAVVGGAGGRDEHQPQ